MYALWYIAKKFPPKSEGVFNLQVVVGCSISKIVKNSVNQPTTFNFFELIFRFAELAI